MAAGVQRIHRWKFPGLSAFIDIYAIDVGITGTKKHYAIIFRQRWWWPYFIFCFELPYSRTLFDMKTVYSLIRCRKEDLVFYCSRRSHNGFQNLFTPLYHSSRLIQTSTSLLFPWIARVDNGLLVLGQQVHEYFGLAILGSYDFYGDRCFLAAVQ